MSLLTAKTLAYTPSATASVTATAGATSPNNGAWVELIASATTDLQIAGFLFRPTSITAYELEWGLGGSGSEVAAGQLFFDVRNTTNTGNRTVMLPIPWDGIPAGQRLAVRLRASANSAAADVSVLYYSALESKHVTTAKYMSTPAVASSGGGYVGGAAITPNGSAWGNSAYAQLTAGIANQIAIVGITMRMVAETVILETDVGTGSGGSEVVRTTFGQYHNVSGSGLFNLWLPYPMPVPANTRIASRLRKSTTTTSGAWASTLLYLDDTRLPI